MNVLRLLDMISHSSDGKNLNLDHIAKKTRIFGCVRVTEIVKDRMLFQMERNWGVF